MSEKTFDAIFESLKALPDLSSVHFGGFGEPMMHPNIYEMIKKVKSLGVQVEMITNGSYLTNENIEKLISVHLDILYTSLDSPDEESYNDIRVGADFKSVTEHIENLQAMKAKRKIDYPKLGIEFVAMKKNFQSLPALISMAHQLKAFKIIVSNVLPYHISMADEILYDLDDSKVLFGKASLKTTLFAEVSHMKLRTERSCKFIEDKTISINHLGEVSPCYALMHAYKCYIYGREKQIYPCHIGNVTEASLTSLWMNPGYVNFRECVKDSNFPSCTDCKSVEGCTYTESNEMDCWGNSPSCGDCLWARRIIACP
jgi:tungsten cofactor oxidoreducase radical SAM maturase